jgi:hypothetical protein
MHPSVSVFGGVPDGQRLLFACPERVFAFACSTSCRASAISRVAVAIRSWDWDTNDSARSVILPACSTVISLRRFAISPIPPIFFTFQCLIELGCKFSKLGWIHFFTDLLSKITPITGFRGHGKHLSMSRLFSSYSGLNCESEHNCTTLLFSGANPPKVPVVFLPLPKFWAGYARRHRGNVFRLLGSTSSVASSNRLSCTQLFNLRCLRFEQTMHTGGTPSRFPSGSLTSRTLTEPSRRLLPSLTWREP